MSCLFYFEYLGNSLYREIRQWILFDKKSCVDILFIIYTYNELVRYCLRCSSFLPFDTSYFIKVAT